jgi:hypothetical protein
MSDIVVPESFGQRMEREKGKPMRHPDSPECKFLNQSRYS